MRWGLCGSIDQASQAREAGFDFLEVGVQAVLRGLETDEAWARTAPDVAKLPLPIEAANMLVPAAMPIVGPARDLPALGTYMRRVAARARKVGISRLVFGSGGARRSPEGVAPDVTRQHLEEFACLAGDACAAHDVVLVIEHLQRGETNTLNALGDCLALCRRVSRPSVQMLVDSYHYAIENEVDQALLDLKGTLAHAHVAEPSGRLQPGAAPNDPAVRPYDFVSFFRLLRRVGYNQRISVESAWTAPVPEAGPACVRLLRDAWDAAAR